jgi:hypothetical protein
MGRPLKNKVDWFHYDAGAMNGRTIKILRGRFGAEGYAVWFMTLDILSQQDGLYFDFSDPIDWEYYVTEIGIDEEKLIKVLDLLAKLKAIDPECYTQKIIWVQNFADRLSSLWDDRKCDPPRNPLKIVSSGENPVSSGENPVNRRESTQSRVEKSRVEKSRVEPPYNPPIDGKPLALATNGDRLPLASATNGSKKRVKDRIQYAEFVSMTDDEHSSLVAKHGENKVREMIEILDNYKGSSGKKYKSDYRAILSWVVDKINKEQPSARGQPDGKLGNVGRLLNLAAKFAREDGRNGQDRNGDDAGVFAVDLPAIEAGERQGPDGYD